MRVENLFELEQIIDHPGLNFCKSVVIIVNAAGTG